MAGPSIWNRLGLREGATAAKRSLSNRWVLLFVVYASFHSLLLSSLQGTLISVSGHGLDTLQAVIAAPATGVLVVKLSNTKDEFQLPNSPTAGLAVVHRSDDFTFDAGLKPIDSPPTNAAPPSLKGPERRWDRTEIQLDTTSAAGNSTSPMFTVPGVRTSKGKQLIVSSECSAALITPNTYLSRRLVQEEAYVAFQAWVYIISLFAVFRESVPHCAAVLVAHLLASIFAIFEATQTNYFSLNEDPDLAVLCGQTDELLDSFWTNSIKLEITIAVFEWVGLLVLLAIGWKLKSVLEWRTFKRIGADRKKSRVHLTCLAFELSIQMLAFFLVTFQAVWIEELCARDWPDIFYQQFVELDMSYQIALGVLTALVPLWLGMGYWAVWKQSRRWMAGFLLGDIIFLGHTLFLASQQIFNQTQLNFKFLEFLGIVAVIMMTSTFALGLVGLFRFRALLSAKSTPPPSSEKMVIAFPDEDDRDYDVEKAAHLYMENLDDTLPPPFSVPSQSPRTARAFSRRTPERSNTGPVKSLPQTVRPAWAVSPHTNTRAAQVEQGLPPHSVGIFGGPSIVGDEDPSTETMRTSWTSSSGGTSGSFTMSPAPPIRSPLPAKESNRAQEVSDEAGLPEYYQVYF